jgi:hypothetical protein
MCGQLPLTKLFVKSLTFSPFIAITAPPNLAILLTKLLFIRQGLYFITVVFRISVISRTVLDKFPIIFFTA